MTVSDRMPGAAIDLPEATRLFGESALKGCKNGAAISTGDAEYDLDHL